MSKIGSWIKNIGNQIKGKKQKAEMTVEDIGKRFREWAKNNPEQAATLGIAFLGATVGIVNGCRRDAKKRAEKEHKEREYYDRSLGTYWCLRRTPTQNEKLEIERRKARGEKYGKIFSDMRLL